MGNNANTLSDAECVALAQISYLDMSKSYEQHLKESGDVSMQTLLNDSERDLIKSASKYLGKNEAEVSSEIKAIMSLPENKRQEQINKLLEGAPNKAMAQNDIGKLLIIDSVRSKVDDSTLTGWKVKTIDDNDDKTGFYALMVETDPGHVSPVFRGSEPLSGIISAEDIKTDWVESDLYLLNSVVTTQQAEVERFFKENMVLLSEYDYFEPVGHSLGGNLAEYFAISCAKIDAELGAGNKLTEKLLRCVSLDGPGYSDEFITANLEYIDMVSDKMLHYRWSFVGTLLNDLPGVEYHFVEVREDAEGCNAVTRHSLSYLDFDSDKLKRGAAQDTLSQFTSKFSKAIDSMSAEKGTAIAHFLGDFFIKAFWVKDQLYKDGKITLLGWAAIAGLVAYVVSKPKLLAAVVSIIAIVVTVKAVKFVIKVTQEAIKLLKEIANAICDAVAEAYNWAKDKLNELKDAVVSIIDSAINKVKEFLNPGYQAAKAYPNIIVDTEKLLDYAQRIREVNRRITDVDKRMDSLYWKVGLFDLGKLIDADLLTSFSVRLLACDTYLRETASEFEAAEKYISGLI